MKRVDPLIERDIEAGGTLVVPTGPRATAVQIAWADQELGGGRLAWRTPDVIAYRGWLEREAYRAADAGFAIPRPLRVAEEWLLWRDAAHAAARDEGFEASDRLSEALRRAAHLLYDWGIPPSTLGASSRAESRLLARALDAVEARALELHAVGSHRLAGLLANWRPARAVTFAGFMERTAARQALVREWSGPPVHCREHEPGPSEEPRRAECVRAADSREELELAASWCRSRLGGSAGKRLLVIVPDLASRGPEALRLFRRALAPEDFLAGGAGEHEPVALEGGAPLVEEPPVRHALATLEFLLGRAEAQDVSAWLRAAFWTAPSAVERAKLDAALREALGIVVTPEGLLGALGGLSGALGGAAERLSTAVEAALERLEIRRSARITDDASGVAPYGTGPHRVAPVPVPLGAWALRFGRALHALGWPGAKPLSAREQQSIAQLGEVLEDLASIGARMGPVAGEEALRMVRALVDRRALTLASDAAVTLSDALADPIARYDGIWIAGLHADAWPGPVELDPFIPVAEQRRAGIGAADPARRLAHARELLRRCRAATGRLMMSWPARGEQGEFLPSPLLAEWPAAPRPLPGSLDSLARSIRASRRMETFEDTVGAPWPARSPLPSGTRAIEYQSRCAFRAYAELRLACVPLGEPRPGIGALDRGRLLHRALELLWGLLGGSRGLEGASRAGGLVRLIEECVRRAADESLPAAHDAAARAAQRRESLRTVQLLAELARLERERPPFRVRSTELCRSLEVGGAALDVRIDRIDELEDGSCAVFDYKTGRTALPDWLAERIASPQLLVYALAADAPVAALAMVQLTPRRIAYRGMADRRDRLPRIGAPPEPALWREHIGRWRDVVERLARGFLRGDAAVDPLGDACATCHLHGFCRIAEAAADQGRPAGGPEAASDALHEAGAPGTEPFGSRGAEAFGGDD